MKDQWLVRVVIVALGLLLGGWAAGNGVARSRLSDRFVTVKGISEREVTADLAIWPLSIVVADNDLGRAQAQVAGNVRKILVFLARHGIDTTQASLQGFQVTDAYANQYQPAGGVASRYVVKQTVMTNVYGVTFIGGREEIMKQLKVSGGKMMEWRI